MAQNLGSRIWGILRYYLGRITVKLLGQNPVIRVEDIPPGHKRDVEVGGVTVLLANVNGKFYAINNVCTHRQFPLSAGDLSGTTVTCACHGSQFDVSTGKVLRGPAVSGVPVYRVVVESGSIAIDTESAD